MHRMYNSPLTPGFLWNWTVSDILGLRVYFTNCVSLAFAIANESILNVGVDAPAPWGVVQSPTVYHHENVRDRYQGSVGSLYPVSTETEKSSSVWKRCSKVGLCWASFFQQSSMMLYSASGQSAGCGCLNPWTRRSTTCWLFMPSRAHITTYGILYKCKKVKV